LNRGDIEAWIRNVFFLDELALAIEEIRKEPLDIMEKVVKLKKVIRDWIEG